MVDNDYSVNRLHEYARDPGSELIGHQRSVMNRLSTIQSFPAPFQQAVVREVFFDPTLLDDDRIDELITRYNLTQLTYIRRMPRHSILAELVRDGTTPQQAPQIFFPFNPPHHIMPVKAGERVWVYREAAKLVDYGYWLHRVTEPRDIDDLNLTHADRKLDLATKKGDPPGFSNGALIVSKGAPKPDAQTVSIDGDENEYATIIQQSDSGAIVDFESVPRFTVRPGDHALQGSNNTLISLGTDRTGAAAESEVDAGAKSRKGSRAKGKPKNDAKMAAGTIDIVVGRGNDKSKSKQNRVKNALQNEETEKRDDLTSEGDPDFDNDLSRIYVSMKTAADDNFNIKTKGLTPTLKRNSEGSAIVVKSDHLRLVARKEIRILVQPTSDSPDSDCPAIVLRDTGEIIIIPADKGIIKLGGDDADKAILCSNQGVSGKAVGQIICPPLVTTMGGVFGSAGAQGLFASKVLVK